MLSHVETPSSKSTAEQNMQQDLPHSLFGHDDYIYFDSDLFMTEQQTARETLFLREHLDLGPETRLLDLGCGTGRHTNALAKSIHSAVGIDFNRDFVQAAQDAADQNGLSNLRYEQQDIREFVVSSMFNRVTILGTIFGLFTDSENANLLGRVNDAVVPDGLVCLDVINRDTVLVDFCSDFVYEKEQNLLIDRCTFDAVSGRIMNNRIYLRNGCRRDASFSLRTYNFTELAAILRNARFEMLHAFADWQGTAFGPTSKKLVAIARKY